MKITQAQPLDTHKKLISHKHNHSQSLELAQTIQVFFTAEKLIRKKSNTFHYLIILAQLLATECIKNMVFQIIMPIFSTHFLDMQTMKVYSYGPLALATVVGPRRLVALTHVAVLKERRVLRNLLHAVPQTKHQHI